MAKVLANMAATGQRTAADLQAEVVLMLALVVARAAHDITTVVPACLLGAADLGADVVGPLTARHLLFRSATAALT